MRVKKWLQDDKGFSLVEVVLAVAILALVTLPIINYFTYSSLHTFEGRDKQTANMVAEDVLEELNSYNHYDEIEELPKAVPAWSVDTSDIACSYLERKVFNNDRYYDVKVKVDYDEYDNDTRTIVSGGIGDEIDTQYNDYEIPRPSEIYSSENIVASEDDQLDEALSEFYIAKKATVPKVTILNGMSRTICVGIGYLSGTDDMYRVKVYYRYEYDGHSYNCVLQDAEIEADKLKNVFIFYNLHRDDVDVENISVSLGSEIPDEDVKEIKILFACQKPESGILPTGYQLAQVSTDPRASLPKYYANVPTSFEMAKKEDGTPDEFVPKEKIKRIGALTVEVREDGGTEVLATLVSTKAE